MVRRASTENFERIDHLARPHRAVPGRPARPDLASPTCSSEVQPDEVYNLAAQSFVPTSLEAAGADRRVHRPRRHAHARRHPPGLPEGPLLPGVVAARCSARCSETPQTRDDAVLPAQPLRRRQGVRPLHHGQLPRELRPVRLLGHPVQPRVAAARPGVRHAQDHARRGADQARPGRRSCGWATWTPSATGASPATTSGPCG